MIEENVWNSVLSAIEKRINHESFTTWFRPITFLGREGVTIRLGAPDRDFEYWILNNYRDVVKESLEEADLSGCSINFEIIHDSNKADETNGAGVKITPRREIPAKSEFSLPPIQQAPVVQSTATIAQMVDSKPSDLSLNQKYTFENFVVGSCNQFAHAAALKVANYPSKSYNPLYVYGGVGLGKTHLMIAICHHIKEKDPELKFRYISSKEFMDEYSRSNQGGQRTDFQNIFRAFDVLLIDDIQFITKWPKTQDEFFHTFYTLYEKQQKQIVISSDCPPKDIPNIEERLHSRFEWGLIVDIQPPDLNTRIDILRKKAEMEKLNLTDDIAFYIAEKVKSNIRELEGALVRLGALASFQCESISLSLAKEALRGIVEDRPVTIELIQEVVASYFDMKVDDLKSKSNARKITEPRQVAMYICKTLIPKASLKDIGRKFGGKDHTTVMHSIDKISELHDQNGEIEKGNIRKIIISLKDSCQ